MIETLLQRLQDVAGDRLAGTGIVVAYAYGSRVKGSARRDSDLDVGYYLGRDHSKPRLSMHDEMVLEDVLTRAVGVEVDLRCLDNAPLEVRGNVLETGVRVYCADERERVSIESRLLSEYHDYKPMFAQMHKDRLAAFAEAR